MSPPRRRRGVRTTSSLNQNAARLTYTKRRTGAGERGHGVPLARLQEREEALELAGPPEGRAEGAVGLRGSGVNVFAAMETRGPLDKRSGARDEARPPIAQLR